MLRECPRCKWTFHQRKAKRCPGCGARLVLPSDATLLPEKGFWSWNPVSGWSYVADLEESLRTAVEKPGVFNRRVIEEAEARRPSMKRIQWASGNGGKGMGVRLRGKRWEVRLQVNGQRIEKTIAAENKTDAIRILKQMEAEALRNPLSIMSAWKVAFDDLASDLEADWTISKKRDLKSLPGRIAHLKGYFGGRAASSITTADVRAYTAARQARAQRMRLSTASWPR